MNLYDIADVGMINITSSSTVARFVQFLMSYSILKYSHKAEDADKY